MHFSVHAVRRIPGTTRRLLAAVAALSLAGAASMAMAAPVRGASMLDVDVGFGEGTVAAQAFGPGDMSVLVDDSVRFSITSDEVHTITFGEGPPGPPPNWPVAGWSAPAGPPPWDLGSVDYDGTGFLNTGIILKRLECNGPLHGGGDVPIPVCHPSGHGRDRRSAGGWRRDYAGRS